MPEEQIPLVPIFPVSFGILENPESTFLHLSKNGGSILTSQVSTWTSLSSKMGSL